ncbi:MAG: hypothetical protein RSH78_03830 [Bacilli bacterium]
MKESFVGIILGGDMNSYAVARAFYEEYKIKTIVLGKFPLYPTRFSKLIEGYYDENILDQKVFLNRLKNLDQKYPDKKKIILANTDYYVKLVIHNKKDILKLSKNFIVPTIEEELFDELFNKDTFYKLCDKLNLVHPKTITFDFNKDKLKDFKMTLEYPIFMKPGNTDKYTRNNFIGRQKGYLINNKEEYENCIKLVGKSGYDDKFIIQEYIDSTDDDMYVYTFYSNKNHQVEVMTGGKILMHDRTPELIGNYNAITNAFDEELCKELKAFVEKIKYTGIGHFDVVYDRKRNRYVVFEINIRQGRSNMYTLASGVNLMKYLVDDYIYNKKKQFTIANKEFTVSVVSKHNLKKHVPNHKIKNFFRFTLAPYDMNLTRLYYQYRWDQKILKGFKTYNEKK